VEFFFLASLEATARAAVTTIAEITEATKKYKQEKD